MDLQRNQLLGFNMVAKAMVEPFFGEINANVIMTQGSLLNAFKESEGNPVAQASELRDFLTALTKIIYAAGVWN